MVPAILKQLWLHLQTQFVCNLSARVFNVQNYKYASKAPYVRSMQIIYRKKNSNAHFNFRRNDHSPKKFLMIFGFLMPCIVIIACYSAIFLKVRQSRKNVQSHMKNNRTTTAAASPAVSTAVPASNKNGESSGKNAISAALNAAQSAQRREDIRLTKMMLTIFLCFLVSTSQTQGVPS